MVHAQRARSLATSRPTSARCIRRSSIRGIIVAIRHRRRALARRALISRITAADSMRHRLRAREVLITREAKGSSSSHTSGSSGVGDGGHDGGGDSLGGTSLICSPLDGEATSTVARIAAAARAGIAPSASARRFTKCGDASSSAVKALGSNHRSFRPRGVATKRPYVHLPRAYAARDGRESLSYSCSSRTTAGGGAGAPCSGC